MRRSRKIRSAEKVLHRLSTILEYPYRMKKSLEREDYGDVINMYQRIINIPSSSSLHILQRIRESADGIMRDAKSKCVELLKQASTDVDILLRHAKILRDLEGEESFRENLRQCFYHQCIHVYNEFVSIVDGFSDEALKEYKHSQDVRQAAAGDKKLSNQQESNLRSFERDIMQELLRKASSSKQGGASLFDTSRNYSKFVDDERYGDPDSFDSNTNKVDDEFEAVFLEESDPHQQETPKPERPTGRSRKFSMADLLNVSSVDDDVDIGVILSVKVRLNFARKIMSSMKKWLPCLHRLVVEISAAGASGQVAIRGPTRGLLPSRQLGSIIQVYSEAMRQAMTGFSIVSGQSVRELAELIISKDIKQTTLKRESVKVNEIVSGSLEELLDDSSKERILSSSYYSSTMPEFFQMTIIRDISSMYNFVENLLAQAIPAGQRGLETSEVSYSQLKFFFKYFVAATRVV